jgi:hypothetical protein
MGVAFPGARSFLVFMAIETPEDMARASAMDMLRAFEIVENRGEPVNLRGEQAST